MELVLIRLTCGLLVAVILCVLGVFHWYWAAGGQRGLGVVLPELNGVPAFRPSRAAVATTGVLLIVAAAIVLGALGFLGGTWVTGYFRLASVGLFSLFLIRTIGDFHYCGFSRRIHSTRFAKYDRWFFTPLCLVLAALLAVVAFAD